MKREWLTRCTALVGILISHSLAAEQTPPAAGPAGWDAILVAPADPILAKAVPSPGQLAYQTNQMGAFLHYGPAVFLDGDWKSTPDAKVFNPVQLDAEQWVRVAKTFDAKHLVFSSKHHNGFCLWQTKTTDYGVRSCPWKDGKGDVVREISEACKKHGLGLGLYYSGQDRHFPCYGWPDTVTLKNREAYWPVYRQQIEELMTNYGPIVCLWLDSFGDPFDWEAIDPKTGKAYGEAIVKMVKAKQPNIVIWHGSRPDMHYCKNEEGVAPYPLWNVIRKGEGAKLYDLTPHAEGWIIPETYNCHGTFAWVRTPVEKLIEQYYTSIARGANFLQALVPDKRGLIDDLQAKTVAEYGAEIRKRFGHPIAKADTSNGWPQPGVLDVDLGTTRQIAHIVLEEEIAKGQHILRYVIEVSAGGTWKKVAEGESVGRKRIERFQPPLAAEKVRLRILKAYAMPSVSAMMVFAE